MMAFYKKKKGTETKPLDASQHLPGSFGTPPLPVGSLRETAKVPKRSIARLEESFNAKLAFLERKLRELETGNSFKIPTYNEFMDFCRDNRGEIEFAGYFYRRNLNRKRPDRASITKVLDVLREMEKQPG